MKVNTPICSLKHVPNACILNLSKCVYPVWRVESGFSSVYNWAWYLYRISSRWFSVGRYSVALFRIYRSRCLYGGGRFWHNNTLRFLHKTDALDSYYLDNIFIYPILKFITSWICEDRIKISTFHELTDNFQYVSRLAMRPCCLKRISIESASSTMLPIAV